MDPDTEKHLKEIVRRELKGDFSAIEEANKAKLREIVSTEVNRYLHKWAVKLVAFIGVANVVALVGIGLGVYSAATSKAERIAEEVATDTVKAKKELLDIVVSNARTLAEDVTKDAIALNRSMERQKGTAEAAEKAYLDLAARRQKAETLLTEFEARLEGGSDEKLQKVLAAIGGLSGKEQDYIKAVAELQKSFDQLKGDLTRVEGQALKINGRVVIRGGYGKILHAYNNDTVNLGGYDPKESVWTIEPPPN